MDPYLDTVPDDCGEEIRKRVRTCHLVYRSGIERVSRFVFGA